MYVLFHTATPDPLFFLHDGVPSLGYADTDETMDAEFVVHVLTVLRRREIVMEFIVNRVLNIIKQCSKSVSWDPAPEAAEGVNNL